MSVVSNQKGALFAQQNKAMSEGKYIIVRQTERELDYSCRECVFMLLYVVMLEGRGA
jgi:hypothetical protein